MLCGDGVRQPNRPSLPPRSKILSPHQPMLASKFPSYLFIFYLKTSLRAKKVFRLLVHFHAMKGFAGRPVFKTRRLCIFLLTSIISGPIWQSLYVGSIDLWNFVKGEEGAVAGEILITLSLGHSNWDGVEGREILGAVNLLYSGYLIVMQRLKCCLTTQVAAAE